MKQDSLFKPTKLYRELLMLRLISSNDEITQRDLSTNLNVSVSMVNKYIEMFEANGLIKRTYLSSKIVKYKITSKGEERRKLLSVHFLKSSMDVFNNASIDCIDFLKRLVLKGYKNVYLYGAGEVGEIILYAYNNISFFGLNVMGVIDDDEKKIGNSLLGHTIESIDVLKNNEYDGVLISSYTNKDVMTEKLKSIVGEKKILEYV